MKFFKRNKDKKVDVKVDYDKNYETPDSYKQADVKKRIDVAKANAKDPNIVETNIEDIKISTYIELNIERLKEAFKDCADVVYKDFVIGEKFDTKLTIVYVDGLVDKNVITENVTKVLMQEIRQIDPKNVKHNLYEVLKKASISAPELKDADFLEQGISAILEGDTMLLIDGYDKILVIGSRGWDMRGVSEPQTEALVRGPRDGFNETLKTNITLVRRRVRDTKLKVKMMKIGRRSKTDVAMLYIEDIADKRIIDELESRLSRIDTDCILDSAYIEEFIEDDNYSIFPQIQNTERPDVVAATLYGGRVAIMVDNTPFALISPITANTAFISAGDYYERWVSTFIVRPIRYLAAAISTLAPALYIAVTSFHPGILPTKLALHIASSRAIVPLPSFLEAFIMMITVEFLRESGTRMSGPIGTTVGVVGGLVVGQSAVEAGLVAPLMVIITALTTVSIFMIPDYSFTIPLRIINFMMMFLASVLGLYGIILGVIGIMIHLCGMTCLGEPYLAPFGILGKHTRDLEDTIIRMPMGRMKMRPHYGALKDQRKTSENTRKD